MQVLERAAQAVELGRMIERDDTAIQLRVHGGFLLDLLDERLGTEASAAARLRALGVSDGAAYVGAVARLREEPPSDAGSAQRRMVRLSEQVHEALTAAGASGLVGVLDGGHVGILITDDAVLDAVARELRVLEPDAVLGAGQAVDRLLAAATSLRSARVVVDVAVTAAARSRLLPAVRHPAARTADVAARGRAAAGVRRGRAGRAARARGPARRAGWSTCCASSSPSAATRRSWPGSPTATGPRSTPRCGGSRTWSVTRSTTRPPGSRSGWRCWPTTRAREL